ncbi:hypothetical protein BV898_19515 [Hypsibius exemplaris]|uniref:Ninjurin-1 n=1 Tax=Hypsibius exemplaris TaxID=2072580 RepID=A0A9X6RP71_HYPEX|nr:hypothetical protein BV898_19515 [Hypsibius exemplaris]
MAGKDSGYAQENGTRPTGNGHRQASQDYLFLIRAVVVRSYTLCMGLLITSIILQLLVAILLLVVGRMDYEPNRGQRKRDNRWVVAFNDISTAGIFFITVVNIFIASFIAHGKAYIPPVNAESAWNEKMYQQRKAWELTSKSNTSH